MTFTTFKISLSPSWLQISPSSERKPSPPRISGTTRKATTKKRTSRQPGMWRQSPTPTGYASTSASTATSSTPGRAQWWTLCWRTWSHRRSPAWVSRWQRTAPSRVGVHLDPLMSFIFKVFTFLDLISISLLMNVGFCDGATGHLGSPPTLQHLCLSNTLQNKVFLQ